MSMLHILVVDDEPGQRAGLAGLIHRLRPEADIWQARNGHQALELVEANPVNVIFADIRMPEMDGIAFVAALGRRIPAIKVIFLSAHSDFTYAAQAIRLGAIDYLLKPATSTMIDEVLTKAEQLIASDSAEQLKQRHMEDKLAETMPAYVENQLNRFLREGVWPDEGDLADLLPRHTPGLVLLIWSTAGSQELPHGRLRLQAALSALGRVLSFSLHSHPGTLAVLLFAREEEPLTTEAAESACGALLDSLRRQENLVYRCAVGPLVAPLFSEIFAAFEGARQAREMCFFDEAPVLSHAALGAFVPMMLPVQMCQQYWDAVGAADLPRVRRTLEELFATALSGGRPEPYLLLDAFRRLQLGALGAVQHFLNDRDFDLHSEKMQAGLRLAPTCDALRVCMASQVEELMTQVEEQKRNKGGMVIEKCLEFIDEHFSENLSAEQMADRFHFNYSYFCNLFKKNTGRTFSQYLLDMRLRRARELLSTTTLRVYEVAGRCGFNDDKYFIRAFKKELGLTPDEYRRLK